MAAIRSETKNQILFSFSNRSPDKKSRLKQMLQIHIILKHPLSSTKTGSDSYCQSFTECINYVTLDISTYEDFDVNDDDVITTLINKLPQQYFPSSQQLFGLHLIVPEEKACCKGRIDPRAASMQIFDIDTIYNGLKYHGVCKGCKKSFYYSCIDDCSTRMFKKRKKLQKLQYIQHFLSNCHLITFIEMVSTASISWTDELRKNCTLTKFVSIDIRYLSLGYWEVELVI